MPVVRCEQCGKALGVRRADGMMTLRHRGREITARNVQSITCDGCRYVTQFPARGAMPVRRGPDVAERRG